MGFPVRPAVQTNLMGSRVNKQNRWVAALTVRGPQREIMVWMTQANQSLREPHSINTYIVSLFSHFHSFTFRLEDFHLHHLCPSDLIITLKTILTSTILGSVQVCVLMNLVVPQCFQIGSEISAFRCVPRSPWHIGEGYS